MSRRLQMLVTCWSVKGGSGTTVTAALIGLQAAYGSDRPVLLVDLCGDLPAVFGVAELATGLSEWTSSELSPCSLERTFIELTPNLSLLPLGQMPMNSHRADELLEWLEGDATVVVDAGVQGREAAKLTEKGGELGRRLVSEADRSVLVTRACYLALRRAVTLPVRPDSVVLVVEAGRALTRLDCERAIGAPVLAEVAIDPDIARAVDAGMLRTRVPKGALRAFSRLAEAA